jgi:hypothetical protein
VPHVVIKARLERLEAMATTASVITSMPQVVILLQKPANEPDNYIIEKTKEIKRTRTYSVDDKELADEHDKFIKHGDGHSNVPANGSTQVDKSSSEALQSTEEDNDGPRQRRPSKLSFKGDEKKPFDRVVSGLSRCCSRIL